MNLNIKIENIQHIVSMEVKIDLQNYNMACIVSKNGVGKTTLLKAFSMLYRPSIIKQTCPTGIISEDSKIEISIDDSIYKFFYSPAIDYLESKGFVRTNKTYSLELATPFGDRFQKFSKLSALDDQLRTNVLINNYQTADEMSDFLNSIYENTKFKELKTTMIDGVDYYFLIAKNGRYIREDHFSTGEYFIINLYRHLSSTKDILIIDEIDTSLDAAAQVRLITHIREMCKKSNKKIIFTSHSLALLRTLQEDHELLLFLENEEGVVKATPCSYNYVKSSMYGFVGYDRYILTEDIVLEKYLIRILSTIKSKNSYKVIFIGGCQGVISLMDRNKHQQFLSNPKNVISILDGDVKKEILSEKTSIPNIYFIPFDSIEKELFKKYRDRTRYKLPKVGYRNSGAKHIFEKLSDKLSFDKIIGIVEKGHRPEIDSLKQILVDFMR
ncbi:ATP-binding protein [Dickeya ananatis]|uniref:AAA family ATPase n=1 Tax=Dickeya ananatis TaxID=3061286 RepID=UPI001CE57409|nr:ATP-binding protein [Dickeya zeae]